MSSSVDLKPAESLNQYLENYSSKPIRAAVIRISNESSFEVSDTIEKSSSLESDFEKLRQVLLASSEPAFALIHDQTRNDLLQFISYVPESANVRNKMLYASSRAGLIRIISMSEIDKSFFASTIEELNYKSFFDKLTKENDSAPLRQDEKDKQHYNESLQSSTSQKRSLVTGSVAMELDDNALKALEKLRSVPQNTLLLFSVRDEVICIEDEKENIAASDVKSFFHPSEPRFGFFSLSKDKKPKTLFIYICPMQSTVKNRMVYSSCKLAFLDKVQNNLDVTIDGRLESNDSADCTEKEILQALGLIDASKESNTRSGFSRPRPPRRR
ncbi:twinfilin [Schizosaccharomyces cryophilus OY26]|uniref:Twinfilin n=1 Tax=Schizosaccharomyces cryophilus (strain OY26 / ATCC MYA-4695 / CBS 11777 / NBRC 106824 / NRRL Y48691) TaxID=653667 RepID=S9X2E5_SCHCR|nr:twinfilin [Schizosaccharomyces cryophilus OY26]EPY51272.1 twinfilin [Schizosaccharomyces cryophilus OY26]